MKYFFIGIKGSGMASLAQIMQDLNNEVSGSDITQHIFTEDILLEKNITVLPFNENNIKSDMIIVKGNSFDNEHVEVKKALELNLKIYSYVELLALLIKQYYSICVAGTHGKTTTTGLVKAIFQTKEQTGYLIGDGHGMLSENSINFIVESCEYKDNYLNYYPNVAIINNIELDHVDYFHSMKQYIDSFTNFSKQASDFVIINGDEDNCLKVSKQENFYYFGLNDNNDFQAKNVKYTKDGIIFDLYTNYKQSKRYEYTFKLALYGKHMVLNCLAAIATYILKTSDLDYQSMEKGLNLFKGVARRFEIIESNTNVFIDDYAHHPTAIGLMIETVKQKYPDKKIVAFFKPDRYSRIYEFGKEIAVKLEAADEVYLFEFPSTSVKEEGIDIDMNYVLNAMNKGKIIEENKESIKLFKDYKNTVFLMMSSKNVYDFRNELIKSLR